MYNLNNELLFLQGVTIGNMILVKYEYGNLFKQFHPSQIYNILIYGFRISCKYNKEKVAKWLFEKWQELSIELNKHINIHETDSTEIDAFESCCIYGHIDIAKYILEMVNKYNLNFDIHTKAESYFAACCLNNKLEMAKWLLEKTNEIESPVNIRINNDRIFKICCAFVRIDSAKWLCDLCQNYKIENIRNDKIEYIIIPDNINLINENDIVEI
jgi:hypothetical protein